MAPNVTGNSKNNLEDLWSFLYDYDDIESVYPTFCFSYSIQEDKKYLLMLKNAVHEIQQAEIDEISRIINQINQKISELQELKHELNHLIKMHQEASEEKQNTLDTGLLCLSDYGLYNFSFQSIENIQKYFREKFIHSLRQITGLNLNHISKMMSALQIPKYEKPPSKVVPKFTIGCAGDKAGEFKRPWGVCTDYLGRILVADRSNHRIQVFDQCGVFSFEIGKQGSKHGEFNCPSGVAVNSWGSIIVADKDNHRIQTFTTNGAFLSRFGKQGHEPGEFNYPWDVAVNKNDEIAVSDSKNHRVQLFSRKGHLLHIFGAKSASPRDIKYLNMPKGLDFRRDGHLLVANFNKHQILLLDENFKLVRKFGDKGNEPGLLLRPQGVAWKDDFTFAVSDCKNYRIQVMNLDGTVVECFGSKGSGIGELDCPQGVAYHQNGSLIVVDFGNNRVPVF